MTPKTTGNVTFGDISTAVSNKDAANKQFNINANARVNGGKFSALESGNLTKVDGTGNGWFSYDSSNNFNFGCNGFTPEEISEAMKAVMDFYNDVKVAIDSKTAE